MTAAFYVLSNSFLLSDTIKGKVVPVLN